MTREVVRLALPVVISNLGLMAMAWVDLLAVGRVGAGAIGAVGVGTAVFSWVMMLGIGLLASLDYLVSHAFGAKRPEDGASYFVQAIWISVLIGIPLTALLVFLTGHLQAFGIRPEAALETAPYLRLIAYSLIPSFFFVAFQKYLQAHGSVRPAMTVMLLANLINAAGNYALVLGNWGAPALGTVGSAWTTLLARVWMVGALGAYLLYWDRQANGGLLRRVAWRIDLAPLGRMMRVIRLGLPSAMQMTLEVGVFATATGLAARFQAVELAAHQVVLNIASMSFMVPLGASSAAAVLVGQAIGRGQREEARRVGWACVRLALGFMAFSCVVLLSLPQLILSVYTHDPAVIAAGQSILFVAALFQLSDGAQVVATGALRGLGNTRTPMLANLGGHWLVGLPLGIWLGFAQGWGLRGLWIGLAFGLTLVGGALLWRWAQESARGSVALAPEPVAGA